jgi:Fungalysin metallopeptidase (M36)
MLVDTRTREVLLRRNLTCYISDATYRVFTSDSPSPFSPGHPTPLTSQPPFFNRELLTLSALDTNASPAGWINDGGNETLGNNVDAHTDLEDDDFPDLPRPHGSPFRVFDFPLDVTQDPANYRPAAVVQLFYWCNWMHDKLYELGFTEAAGNFQADNFGRGGLGNDAVLADAQDGGGINNAFMNTDSDDGAAPRMQMYLWSGSGPVRDGDLDAEVILHEYTHGLSNRRVGGGVGLSALQSQGLGEGWSDFYALALLSQADDDVGGIYALAAYVMYLQNSLPGNPPFAQNYYFGIRSYPYTTNMSKNPLTFGNLSGAPLPPPTSVPKSPIIPFFPP